MYKILKEHIGDIKFLLILIAMLISIAVGEVAVLAACLALSACIDEIRIQILFKERRQLTNLIKELKLSSDTQTSEIKTLQGLSQEVKGEVRNQTRAIKEHVFSGAIGAVLTVAFGVVGLVFSEKFGELVMKLINR